MPLFNSDALVNVDQHPGFISGKYYSHTPFGAGTGNSSGTSGLAANSLIYTPLFVPLAIHIDRLVLRVQGAISGSTSRIIIYSNSLGLPANLLADTGDIDTSASGTKEGVVNCNLAIGWYWLAANCNVSPNILIYTGNTGFQHFLGLPSTFITPSAYCYMQTGVTYGTPPSTAPVSSLVSRSGVPVFQFRVA